MKRKWIIIFSIIMIFCACTSQKKLIYFQGEIPPINKDSIYIVRIHPGDILSINVFTINADAYPFLSPPNQPGGDNRSAYEKGYLISQKGEIKLPLVGAVSLQGLTILEATAVLEQKFQEYIQDPIVTIKKLNFKVTVLGEVNKPGTYPVLDEQVTLPEILGMAGDLTNFADREKLRIIREENGERKDIFVNLTDAKSLSAAVYYLHPNDIIYVQALKRKALQNSYPAVAIFTSIVTSTIVVLTFIVVTNK
jgi:polysaccharide biosynthesis/export protein